MHTPQYNTGRNRLLACSQIRRCTLLMIKMGLGVHDQLLACRHVLGARLAHGLIQHLARPWHARAVVSAGVAARRAAAMRLQQRRQPAAAPHGREQAARRGPPPLLDAPRARGRRPRGGRAPPSRPPPPSTCPLGGSSAGAIWAPAGAGVMLRAAATPSRISRSRAGSTRGRLAACCMALLLWRACSCIRLIMTTSRASEPCRAPQAQGSDAVLLMLQPAVR